MLTELPVIGQETIVYLSLIIYIYIIIKFKFISYEKIKPINNNGWNP
jgi:hypothetical protein